MDVASAQVMLLLAMSVSVMLLLQYYKRKCRYTRSPRPAAPSLYTGHSAFRILAGLLMGIQILMILVPVLGIVYLSFNTTHSIMMDIFPHSFTLENYREIADSPRVLQPLLNSLKMSFMTVGAGILLTVPVSYLNWRRKSLPAGCAKALMMLPWCMPVSVIGINMINAFNVKSIFAFGRALIGGFYILPIAYTVTALPLLLSSNDTAMESFHPVLEDASHSLGGGGLATLMRVVLPNIAPGILAGGILVFIRTMGEYTVSALLYGVHNRPISISMVTNMQEFNIGVSMAYGVIVILISLGAMMLMLALDKKRFI